jgi:transcriptional regulator with XRE-family HTH domain
MSDLYERIGKKIRELRTHYPKGTLSQDALAAKLSVGANTVSRWETGTYKPTAEDLDKLARFFQVSITAFFPDEHQDETRVAALTSALGGLDPTDLDEVVRYAEFRRARRALDNAKPRESKKP